MREEDIMNREELITVISNYRQALLDDKKIEVNTMLVDQNNQRKNRYKGLILKLGISDIRSVVVKSLEYLAHELTQKTLGVYDLEISIDDVIQTEKKERVVHGEEILEQLSVKYTSINTVQEDTDLSKIKFVVIQLYYQERALFLFQKYTQPSTALKTSEKYMFFGGQLKPYDGKIITLNYTVDAFLLDETYYILNRNAFNSIFSYKDVLRRILEENSETIINSRLIQNSDCFIRDCESDGRYLTRLTKAILAEGFQKVTEKKTNIKKVIEDFNLSLKVSDQDEIVYRDKADVPEILNLLLRHFVRDALTSDKMIAAAIQDYQVKK